MPSGSESKNTRVLIVDDNEFHRSGFVGGLRDCAGVEVVAAVDHDTALAWPAERWQEADVALVDAADQHRLHDQFPGVAVVEAARRAAAPARLVITVVTAQFFHDGLRRRVREAGADYFLYREDIVQTDILARAVLDPESLGHRWSEEASESQRMMLLGVEKSAGINSFLHYVEGEGLEDVMGGAPSGRPGNRSRWWSRVRVDATDAGRIRPVTREGNNPNRRQSAASLAQLRNLYEWATKVRRRD